MKKEIKTILATAIMAPWIMFSLQAQERPNIIWLMAEDIGPDLECDGMEAVRTPNLNKLAEEGTRFTTCYCSNPICSPNRSAMMTGVYHGRINAPGVTEKMKSVMSKAHSTPELEIFKMPGLD